MKNKLILLVLGSAVCLTAVLNFSLGNTKAEVSDITLAQAGDESFCEMTLECINPEDNTSVSITCTGKEQCFGNVSSGFIQCDDRRYTCKQLEG